MNSQTTVVKRELDPGISEEEIDQLIQERTNEGATSCEVVTEGGKKFLVCHYPPP